MAEVAKNEPSMEDILSSIRKIIAEEGGTEESVAPEKSTFGENAPEDMTADIRPTIDSVSISEPQQAPEPEVVSPATEPAIEVASEIPERTFTAPEPAANTIAEMPVAPDSPADLVDGGENTSLASIAASIQNVAQAVATNRPVTNEAFASEEEHPVTASMPADNHAAEIESQEEPHMQHDAIRVEMAEATAAPAVQPAEEIITPPASDETMAREEEAFRGALMSPSADHAVTDSFDRLKRSSMDDIEATTEAILRPMLREWLDEHLPTLVEKLVREEIERVARG